MANLIEIEKDPQVVALFKNTEASAAWVTELEIKTAEDEKGAIEALAEVKTVLKNGNDLRKFFVDPLRAQIERIDGLFKPKLSALLAAETAIKGKLAAYQQQMADAADAARKKVLEKVNAGKMKVETAVKKIENVPEAQKTVRTEAATVSYREVRKVVITDPMKLPREYLIPDEVKIRKVVLAGVEVPGTKIVVEKVPAIKTNF